MSIFVYDRTIVVAYDGVNTPKKSVDGMTWTNFGITPPAAPTLSAVSTTGTLVTTHVYEVAYTYVDDGVVVRE